MSAKCHKRAQLRGLLGAATSAMSKAQTMVAKPESREQLEAFRIGLQRMMVEEHLETEPPNPSRGHHGG